MAPQVTRPQTFAADIGRVKARTQNLERAPSARPGPDHVVVCASLPEEIDTYTATSTRWYPTFGVRFYEMFVSRQTSVGESVITMRRNGVEIASLTIPNGDATGKVAIDLVAYTPQQYVDFIINGLGAGFTIQARARSNGQDSGAVIFTLVADPPPE